MEQITLDTAFITEGLAHIAFWNGRVLTAEDLRDEQLANHLARRQLGRALGSGVAHGMRVSTSATLGQINVSAGLAIDTLGQVVELPVDVTVSLVVPPETAHGDDLFTVCQPLASNSPTGTGVYLLVVRPATRSQSSVAGVSAFGNGVATECGPKYTVDGISFRLVGVDASVLAADLGHDAADVAVLDTVGSASVSDTARNILAHLFLDTRANAVRSSTHSAATRPCSNGERWPNSAPVHCSRVKCRSPSSPGRSMVSASSTTGRSDGRRASNPR